MGSTLLSTQDSVYTHILDKSNIFTFTLHETGFISPLDILQTRAYVSANSVNDYDSNQLINIVALIIIQAFID